VSFQFFLKKIQDHNHKKDFNIFYINLYYIPLQLSLNSIQFKLPAMSSNIFNLIFTKSIHVFHQLITSNKQQYETQVEFYASKTIYTLEKYITIYAQWHRPK